MWVHSLLCLRGGSRQAEAQLNKFSTQDAGAGREQRGRTLVGPESQNGKGRDREPQLRNAYHRVPGISVGVRGSRMNSVKRHENLTRTDWFDLRALLFGVFSLLLFKVI